MINIVKKIIEKINYFFLQKEANSFNVGYYKTSPDIVVTQSGEQIVILPRNFRDIGLVQVFEQTGNTRTLYMSHFSVLNNRLIISQNANIIKGDILKINYKQK